MPVKTVVAESCAGLAWDASEIQRIRVSLDRICGSSEFARSEQMARFLRFLVERELEGDSVGLKETLIGTRVFGKAADWDPREDTIVRTEARRLRKKLDNYYEGVGRSDRILISVPKGAYRAQISVRQITEQDSLSDGPFVEPPVKVSSDSRSRWSASLVATFALCAVIVVALGFVLSSRHLKTGNAAAFEVSALATAVGQEFSPAISPMGGQVAYVWDGDGNNFDIYIKNIEGGQITRFTDDPKPDLYPAWSPKGDSLAYLRKGDQKTEVIVRSVNGTPERVITRIATESGRWAGDNSPLLGNPGPAWGHLGDHLIVADVEDRPGGTGLYSVSLSTGQRIQLTSAPGEMRDFYPKVSPDGHNLAFVRFSSHGVGQLFVAPLDPETSRLVAEPRQITDHNQTIRGLDWGDRGSRLVFASNQNGMFQLWSLELSNREPEVIPTDTSSVADPSVDVASGRIVFAKTNENWNIWRFTITNGVLTSPTRIVSSSGENHSPAYSPDGTRIAFMSDRSGQPELWVSAQDGSSPKQLTHFKGFWVASPVWSPDARFIAFDARPNGTATIYVIPSSGGTPRPLEQNNFENRAPAWSEDGQTIYFNSNRTGVVALWKKPIDGGTAEQVGLKDSYLAQRDRRGAWYYSDLQGGLHSAGLNWEESKLLPSSVRAYPVTSWTVENGVIYFTSPLEDGRYQINRYSINGAKRMLGVTAFPVVFNTKSLSVSPDGMYLLVSQQDSVGSDIMMRSVMKTH